MEKFEKLTGVAVPFGMPNVDTDMIIPKQFLKTIKRAGLGKALFYERRYDDNGQERSDFVLNQPAYRNARILVAGENFGCGSSREHAAWALADLGVLAVIASSYSDIFSGNAFKNGIAAITLDADSVERLLDAAKLRHTISVDLEEMEVTTTAGDRFGFDMDPFRRECLLGGLDEIGLTLASEAAIRNYELRTGI